MSTSNGNGTVVSSSTEWLDISTAARLFKCSRSTLRAYTNKGLLPSIRFGLAQSRRFKYSDLASLLGLRVEVPEEQAGKINQLRILLFARVSSQAQSTSGDLARQVQECEAYIHERWGVNASVEKHIAVRSGLNFSDKSFSILLQQITSKRFSYIVIRNRERLARVAFNLISELCRLCNTEIVVINKEDEDSEQELISDILSLSHVASCRKYGARGAKAHYKALSSDVVQLISSLTLSGFSEREIYKRLVKENKNRDMKGNAFSISLVRRVRRQVLRDEEVKGVISTGHALPSSASFQAWAKTHLRASTSSKRRGTSERKLLKAYALHCAKLGEAPQSKGTVRRFLEAKCPTGPTERPTGRINRPTETCWPVWLLRPQNGLIGVDKAGPPASLQHGGKGSHLKSKTEGAMSSRRMADGENEVGTTRDSVAANPPR